MDNVNGNKLNRRVALRIHEQANLFYRKVDPHQRSETQQSFDSLLGSRMQPGTTARSPASGTAAIQSLPDSQSRENDTLNVNISASGIAFTCKDELKAGDYLMIRILLLSSMTTITTCCKVVYCKPSNPYETDRYPYLIGAHFVNLTAEDTALLTRYVAKRQQQTWAANGLLLALALTALALPDLAFELLLSLSHHLLEVVLHIVHLAFEFVEYNLDHVIEHAFHTDTHETQIIVFYILFAVGLVGLYFLWRIVPPACARWGNSLMAFWCRKKASCLYYWGKQTLLDKIRIIGTAIIAISCYGYFII